MRGPIGTAPAYLRNSFTLKQVQVVPEMLKQRVLASHPLPFPSPPPPLPHLLTLVTTSPPPAH